MEVSVISNRVAMEVYAPGSPAAPQNWEGELRALRLPDMKSTLSHLTPDTSPLITSTNQDPHAPALSHV